MGGMIMAAFTSYVPPSLQMSGNNLIGDVSGASGFLIPIEYRVTNPGNPQTQYGWSNSPGGGSVHITLASTTAPTTTVGYKVNLAWSGLAIGQTYTRTWGGFATLSGYTDSNYFVTIQLTRTS